LLEKRGYCTDVTKAKLVWTSDPEAAKQLRDSGKLEPASDVDPARQAIRVVVDRKRRAGKAVTVASGFELTPESLARLATSLKKHCGSGGTARGAEIEVQGEHVDAVAEVLSRAGFKVRK
jgi:translation initiation factor 1